MVVIDRNNENNDLLTLPPTILYNLEPLYVTTPWVESMASYVSRLSLEHHVTPRLIHKQLTGCEENRNSFLRCEPTMTRVVDKMNELTGRSDLGALTLKVFKNIMSELHAIHTRRRWCPLCFQEWKEQKRTIYEPIIWSLTPIISCAIHKVALQEICPSCGRHNSVISVPGYCSRCNAWLGQTTILKDDFSQGSYNSIVSNCKTLCSRTGQTPLSNSGLILTLQTLARRVNRRESLFKYSSFSRVQLFLWAGGNSTPSLPQLLEICEKNHVAVLQVLEGISEDDVSDGTVRVYGGFYDNEKLRQAVLSFLAESLAPITVSTLCMKFNCKRDTLARHIPELRQLLRDRNAQISKGLYQHNQGLDSQHVRTTVESILRDSDGNVSVAYIAKVLGISVEGLKRNFPSLVNEIHRRNSQLKTEQLKKLNTILNLVPPPNSVAELCRCVGITKKTLIYRYPNDYRRFCSSVSMRRNKKTVKSSPSNRYSYIELQALVSDALSHKPPMRITEFVRRYGKSIYKFAELHEKYLQTLREYDTREQNRSFEELQRLVNDAIQTEPVISYAEFVRRHGHLIRRYPQLLERLKVAHENYVDREKEAELNYWRTEIEKKILESESNGIYPSQKRIASLLGHIERFSRPALRHEWRRIMIKLGILHGTNGIHKPSQE